SGDFAVPLFLAIVVFLMVAWFATTPAPLPIAVFAVVVSARMTLREIVDAVAVRPEPASTPAAVAMPFPPVALAAAVFRSIVDRVRDTSVPLTVSAAMAFPAAEVALIAFLATTELVRLSV